MKLLVIQEQHFTELPNGEVWVNRQSDIHFWDRYLTAFDELVVCARMKKDSQHNEGDLRSDRKEVSFVGMPDFRGAGGIVKHYGAIQKALKKALKQADCVIFRAPSPISMVSYGIVRRSGKPFAVEMMNNPITCFSPESMHNIYQPLIARFITNQSRRMCLAANGVSYVTNHVLQDLFPSTAKIKGESSDFFESSYSTINLSQCDFVKSEWSQSIPERIVLVHSGEMADYRKGQNVFIEAIAELKKRGHNVYGILIGDGVKRKEFEQLAVDKGISEQIEFVGWQAGFQNVQKILLRGHFFVFPTLGEGLPRSVIEAMASGMLCFGSNIDGVTELLDEDLLVNEFSGKAFAEKIEPYLIDWSAAKEKREILFERSKQYENSKLMKKRRDFYMKLRVITEKRK